MFVGFPLWQASLAPLECLHALYITFHGHDAANLCALHGCLSSARSAPLRNTPPAIFTDPMHMGQRPSPQQPLRQEDIRHHSRILAQAAQGGLQQTGGMMFCCCVAEEKGDRTEAPLILEKEPHFSETPFEKTLDANRQRCGGCFRTRMSEIT